MYHFPIAALIGSSDPVKSQSKRLRSRLRAALSIMTLTLLLPTVAAVAQSKQTPPNKPGADTLGTEQMKGGDGLVGTTYTFLNNGAKYNAKLVRVEYSVTRFNCSDRSHIIPKAGEKLIILHWQIQNPTKSDEYISGTILPFSTVAADGQTRNHSDPRRLAGAKASLEATLKPGQLLSDEVLAAGVVPAEGPVGKLIINYGRLGTGDRVTRYWLGKTPNLVKSLPKVDSDPADATGATALSQVPAKIAISYPLGAYDITVDSIAFVPGPIGTQNAGTGKRFLVVTVTATNKLWQKDYANGLFDASLETADDEKTKEFQTFKGKREERAEGRMMEPDETITYRLAFIVPNDTTGKKLTLAEIVDNSSHKSRALVFDLTGIK